MLGRFETLIVPTTTTKHSMILQEHAVLSARTVSVIADSVFSIPGHLEYLPFLLPHSLPSPLSNLLLKPTILNWPVVPIASYLSASESDHCRKYGAFID